MVAIMFVYSQIKVLIAENIMQSAVNNMAREVASYVYLLDKVNLVVVHKEGETENADNAVSEGKAAVESGREALDETIYLVTGLFSAEGMEQAISDPESVKEDFEGIKGDATSMVDSLKNMVSAIKSMSEDEWKTLGRNAGEEGVKALGNLALSEFFEWKIDAYLPMESERFYKSFMIDPESVSFEKTRIFPVSGKYDILVAVEYDTSSPFRDFPLERHIVKYSLSAAWVKMNANNG